MLICNIGYDNAVVNLQLSCKVSEHLSMMLSQLYITVLVIISSPAILRDVKCTDSSAETPSRSTAVVPSRVTNHRIQTDSRWVGPIVSSNGPGNFFTFSFQVTLRRGKCCPGFVVATESTAAKMGKEGCYNVTKNALDALNQGTPSHILFDWNSRSYFASCTQPNAEGIYSCTGRSEIQFNSVQKANVYAFYPCYVLQNVYFIQATISLEVQTYDIQCQALNAKNTRHCAKFYDQTYLPNVFGTQSLYDAEIILLMMEPVATSGCHKFVNEFLCRSLLPECVHNAFIPPCKSMCKEVTTACKDTMEAAYSMLLKFKGNYDFSINYACETLYKEDHCITRTVTCNSPKEIPNAILNYNGGDKAPVNYMAKYHCKGGFELQGNSTVYCEYSGEWSLAPRCTKGIDTKQVITIGTTFGVFAVLTIVVIILCVIYRQEIAIIMYAKFGIRFRKQLEEVDRDYDAFIAYSQEDIKFVKNKLLKPLERKKPPYKICIHHRDFELGATISANILNAIKQSKRTIIVLSQNFINSPWCHFEFEHAHIQLLENQSHKLIVIALSEPKKLHNVPELIEAYIKTRTYLMSNDKWFAKKLFYHMPDKSRKSEVELTDINHTEDHVDSTCADSSISKRVEQTEKSNKLVDGQTNQTQRHTWIM